MQFYNDIMAFIKKYWIFILILIGIFLILWNPKVDITLTNDKTIEIPVNTQSSDRGNAWYRNIDLGW